MKTFKTYAPVFPGFYCTIFDDILKRKMEENRAEYKEATEEIGKMIVEILNGKLFYFARFEFEEVYSPRYYNYSNNSINVITYPTEKLFSKFEEDKKTLPFQGFVNKRCSSRSGFVSFLSNDTTSEDWQELTDDNVGLYLEYIAQELCYTEEDLYTDLEESFY